MDQFIIRIKDRSKKKFFLDLLKQLDFIDEVKEIKGTSKAKSITEFIGALNEVQQHQAGKIQLRKAKDFLNEI